MLSPTVQHSRYIHKRIFYLKEQIFLFIYFSTCHFSDRDLGGWILEWEPTPLSYVTLGPGEKGVIEEGGWELRQHPRTSKPLVTTSFRFIKRTKIWPSKFMYLHVITTTKCWNLLSSRLKFCLPFHYDKNLFRCLIGRKKYVGIGLVVYR